MKNMELLLQKTPPDVTKSDVLPLIYGSLESDSIQVQELCLAIIPGFAALIDFPAMKNSLLPRIRKLCLSTPSLSVRNLELRITKTSGMHHIFRNTVFLTCFRFA